MITLYKSYNYQLIKELEKVNNPREKKKNM